MGGDRYDVWMHLHPSLLRNSLYTFLKSFQITNNKLSITIGITILNFTIQYYIPKMSLSLILVIFFIVRASHSNQSWVTRMGG